MNRRDILIAKLKAKQRIRQTMQAHVEKFAPPQPQQPAPQGQEGQNARTPQEPMVQPAPDQPVG